MASTINGTSTGSGGLISTGDDSGILNIQTNETTAIAIDASQRAAFVAGTAALPAITTTGDTNTGIFFPAADTIAFSEGGVEAMRIDSSGNFAVGGSTISSRSAFYNGNAARPVSIGSGNIYMQAETGGWGLSLVCLGSSGTNRGGFGFTGSNDTLSAYTVGTAAGTGVQLASGATSWTTWSDIRDKVVVGNVQNGLDAVNALEPLYFLYKNDEPGQRQRIGFSAQNVQAAIPEAVVELEKFPENPTEDSKRLALSMTDIVPVLVKAIQEQQALITAQAETINALTARVVALETA